MVKLYQSAASAAFAALLFTAAPAVAAESEAATTEGVENKKEKPKKITDRNDPNYVRCRSDAIIGSLSRKRRTCMTNAQWKETHQKGSKASREFVDDSQPGFMMTPN